MDSSPTWVVVTVVIVILEMWKWRLLKEERVKGMGFVLKHMIEGLARAFRSLPATWPVLQVHWGVAVGTEQMRSST